MTEIIKRKTEGKKETKKIISYAINSNEVFTMRFALEKDGKEMLININGDELDKLVRFIRKHFKD